MSLAEKQQQRSAAANAVSGKTVRACDSCLRRRARWYCTADDAFLCQSCDSSVHSANPLARRHDRVRLKTSSSSSLSLSLPPSDLKASVPAWHQGFKRKARTPRHAKSSAVAKAPVLLVPDLEAIADHVCEGEVEVDEEEQLLYQVPIFDPVLAEFCSPPVPFDETTLAVKETKLVMNNNQLLHVDQIQEHGFPGFNPSDIELAEFAADVDSLLGQGLDDDSFCIEGLGLLEAREDDVDKSQVKMELMDAIDTSAGGANFLVGMEMEFSRESLEFNFDCGSAGDGVEEQKVERIGDCCGQTKIGLRLDYEAVIAAWSCRGCSPWTDGERPQFKPDDCWPDFMGTWTTVGGEVQGAFGEMGLGGQVGNGDGGREARVSRYREKRRTRLFSKKIRYEVRKLNAEKRPRMKGRFVKRASFPAAGGSDGFPYV